MKKMQSQPPHTLPKKSLLKVRTWAARVWRKVHVALPSSSFVVGPEDFPC